MGKNGKTHIFSWAKMGLDPPIYWLTIQVSVFRNEYEVKKEEARAVLEQHVQLSNSVMSLTDTLGS